ncbi:casein kinase 2 regulatory subunit, partial [Spiromyces aspiralis]
HDLESSGSDSDYAKYWVEMFLSIKGHEIFCEVDEDYIQDRFNLTGLDTEVEHYIKALRRITDREGKYGHVNAHNRDKNK